MTCRDRAPPVSVLGGLWKAKFRQQWVTTKELSDTEAPSFWADAVRRLTQAGVLERVYLADRGQTVYRISQE